MKILPYLPSKIRKFVVRKGIPELKNNLDGITIGCVTEYEDLLECLRLLHDVYVKCGYMQPRIPPIRLIEHHLNRGTCVFMAKKDNKIIYTGTIFQDDKKRGLPIDYGFKQYIDKLREEGRNIIEVGCLASLPEHRKHNKQLPLLMNKLMLLYSISILHKDDIVITTHPKYKHIYEDIMLFEVIGDIRKFGYVEDNPAVALRMDLRSIQCNMRKAYNNSPLDKNLHEFIFNNKSNFLNFRKS